MTRAELKELRVGTLLYNGRAEGVIRMDGKQKVIEVVFPIDSMSDGSTDYYERPENWGVLDTYTGKHHVGEIVTHRGHECIITDVWNDIDTNKNGITIKPTGNYGFEVDIYEELL